MNKLKEGYIKFKQDFIPKVYYDIFKWLFGIVVLLISYMIFQDDIKIKDTLSKSFTLNLYSIILICIVCMLIMFFIYKVYFNKKYEQLKSIAYTDTKTGLKSFKLLEIYLNEKISKVKKDGTSLSVIIIDIDNFKNFNEHHSPTIGDKIIAEVGRLLLDDTRITDQTFRRYETGDEFVVISTDTNITQAKIPAERKRKFIADNNFIIDDKVYKITVSCGIAQYKNGIDTFATLLDRANYAMRNIAKKKNGKNCTESVS